MNEWSWDTCRIWDFHLLPSGPMWTGFRMSHHPSLSCQLIFLWDLGFQHSRPQSHRPSSHSTFAMNSFELLFSKPKTHYWGGSLWRGSDSVKAQRDLRKPFAFSKAPSRDLKAITGLIRGSLSDLATWWDRVHLLFSISTVLSIHFSAPFCRGTKGSHSAVEWPPLPGDAHSLFITIALN